MVGEGTADNEDLLARLEGAALHADEAAAWICACYRTPGESEIALVTR
jgi:hypothetical protein